MEFLPFTPSNEPVYVEAGKPAGREQPQGATAPLSLPIHGSDEPARMEEATLQESDEQMEVGAIYETLKGDLTAAMAVHEAGRRDEARDTYVDMVYLVSSLGQNGKKFRREATARMRAIVSEIYSAPRVTEMARRRARSDGLR